MNPATLRQMLERYTRPGGIPRLEAEVLLCHLLQRPRSYLYAWPERALDPAQQEQLEELVRRRQDGEPIAYITGQREFWSLTLRVTADTLIPRPETEILVEQALHKLQALPEARVADLGTGSGAIAAAIASERPGDHIIATDISTAALAVARHNFVALGLNNIETRQGSWTEALPGELKFDLLLSNPPYVADGDPHLARDGLPREPGTALTSGVDGLDDIRHLAATTREHLKPGGWLLLEHGMTQGHAVRECLSTAGYREVYTAPDLEGRERVSMGRTPLWQRLHRGNL
ncbi:MAG: peptide chain release factor N(5)-glutamine methyltransferase [Sedimenticola sp.]|nr:peptide chain release factor N(5)-glutamine methyltransferase [Sedimenticola sp.]